MTGVGRLLGDRRGNSLVEFGLAAPLLAALVTGMIDGAQGLEHKQHLEQAAQRSVERATAYGTAGADFSGIRADAATAAGVETSQVTVSTWLECDGVRQANFNSSCTAGAQIGRFISVAIADAYDPMFAYGGLGRFVGAQDNGAFRIQVEASVRIQ